MSIKNPALLREKKRNERFSLWILKRLNFKGTGSDQFRGKGSGKNFREKGKLGKRISLGGAEGVEEGQAAEKGRRKTVLGGRAWGKEAEEEPELQEPLYL